MKQKKWLVFNKQAGASRNGLSLAYGNTPFEAVRHVVAAVWTPSDFPGSFDVYELSEPVAVTAISEREMIHG